MMEMLYNLYSQHHPIDNTSMQERFMELEERMFGLSLSERNKINSLFDDIYIANEQEAFQQGFRFGFRLANDLMRPEEETRRSQA